MTTPATRLRLEGAVRYYGSHRDGCEGGDVDACTCGYADLLEKMRDLRESEDKETTDG